MAPSFNISKSPFLRVGLPILGVSVIGMVTLAHFLDQKLQRFDKNLKSQSELEYKKEQEKMQNELEMMQQRLMQSDDGGYEMKRIMRAPDETSESD